MSVNGGVERGHRAGRGGELRSTREEMNEMRYQALECCTAHRSQRVRGKASPLLEFERENIGS